jgi:2,3-bisphosphoglycerate-independent phosphoglycerate mutase
MQAHAIADKAIELIQCGEFQFGRLNLANGDMVGHTGDLPAAIKAMEVIDECVAKLLDAIKANDGILIYTADHGNADIMYTEKDGTRSPKTSHTLSPVPFAIIDPNHNGEYQLAPPSDAGLTHIAATTLNLLGFAAPDDYQPSLISFD